MTMLRRSHPRAFGLTDLCVLLFLVALVASAGVRAVHAARSGGVRLRCASNLRQIGQAIQMYAFENKRAFPRGVFDGAADPVPAAYTGRNAPDPFGAGGPGPNDVTAPLLLLLRAGHVTQDVFICPATNPGFPTVNLAALSNFADRTELSYGYTNPYPGAAARALGYKLNVMLNSDFAVAADMGGGRTLGWWRRTPRARR